MNKYLIGITILLFLSLSGLATAEVPPAPVSLSVDVNETWVNYTWAAGSGNVTDTYNVSISVSGGATVWTNSSATTSNNSVDLNDFVEIRVWAYNDTGDGNLSATYVTKDTQAGTTSLYSVISLLEQLPSLIGTIPAILLGVVSVVMIALGLKLAIRVVEAVIMLIDDSLNIGKLMKGGKRR